MGTLFSQDEGDKRPLAERIRPRELDEVVGQEDILGKNGPLRRLILQDQVRSLIFWGPPGTGKTTVGNIVSSRSNAEFVHLSAAMTGVKKVRKVLEKSQNKFSLSGNRDLLFIDEIHRFNKAQQDVLLPFLEEGSIIFIGATTENPSFEVNSAILSRCQVFVFEKLSDDEIVQVIERVEKHPQQPLGPIEVTDGAKNLIVDLSDGDARRALNTLEMAARFLEDDRVINRGLVANSVQQKTLEYDKSGDKHYNLISALHKTIRNSDPDAALHWLARMLESGEDPVYIARRLVRVASEDVGLADPQALQITVASKEAVELIGMPECDLALAQAVVYLALAPKSNSIYSAYSSAKRDVEKVKDEPVPLDLRNAPTDLMKDRGYGEDYKYAHNEPNKIADIQCMPDGLRGRSYYYPSEAGTEEEMKERLLEWKRRRKAAED